MDIDQLKSNWQQQLAQQPPNEQLNWGKHMQVLEDKMTVLDRNVRVGPFMAPSRLY
jgi:uncharacterized protein YukE